MTFNSALPLELARTLPSGCYKDDDRSVFEQTWQYICPGDFLSNVGDYTSTKILNNPLLFVREENGIKGFHNVCSHHASTLLKGSGHCSKIRCPYHGWTYGLDGTLKGVPEFDGVQDFKREDNGLKKIHVIQYGPFLFAALKAESPIVLSPLKQEDIPAYAHYAREEYDLKCNWKVFVDNYLDGGYHVNSIHPDLASGIDYKNYRNELYDRSVLQIAPLKQSDNPIIQANRTSQGDARYWWFYPNFMLNIYGDMMDVNVVFPTGPSTCKVIMDFFHSTILSYSEIKASIAISKQIQHEDVDICERVQEGLGSDSYDVGRYSVARESGMYLFHQLLQTIK